MRRILWLIALYIPFLSLRYSLFAGYLLWPITMQLYNHLSAVVSVACTADFFGKISICKLANSGFGDGGHHAAAIQTEFSGLETLLSRATEVTPLVQNLMKAHLSIDDLVIAVGMSSLVSRDHLIEELSAISTETKQASRNLQKLFAQVLGSVDIMVAVNEHLLVLLRNRISPASALSVYCYAVGNALLSKDCSFSSLRITEAYQQTLAQFQGVLSTLLLRANVVQGNLDSIEARLDVIRDLVTMESGTILSETSEPLTYILTLLRLPTQRMARLNGQLRSIQEIRHLRAVAMQFISGTFAGLQELEGALEMLRSMALGAELADGVPMEAIINSLASGIERVRRTSGTQLMLSGSAVDM